MATSDNVVRAGLTPKWRDNETLTAMLTYKDEPPCFITPTQPEGEVRTCAHAHVHVHMGEVHVWLHSPRTHIGELVDDSRMAS